MAVSAAANVQLFVLATPLIFLLSLSKKQIFTFPLLLFSEIILSFLTSFYFLFFFKVIQSLDLTCFKYGELERLKFKFRPLHNILLTTIKLCLPDTISYYLKFIQTFSFINYNCTFVLLIFLTLFTPLCLHDKKQSFVFYF